MTDTTGREAVVADEPEPETPEAEAPETPEAQPEEEAKEEPRDDGTEEEPEEDQEEQEPEFDEFDFGGNKLQLPKGSVPDELRTKIDEFTKGTWGDYTRKSQEHAERSKAVEARERAVEKIVSLNGEALQTYSQGLQLKAEIEQLSQIDVNALWQSDPDRARRISDTLARKQAQFQQVVQQVSQKETEMSKAQAEELSRRKEEGKAVIERRVKGFTEKLPEVLDYVVEHHGMDRKEAEENWSLNPSFAVMAYKAMRFDRMQQAQKKTPAPKTPPAQPMKPVANKGGRASLDLVKDADKMSVDEWTRKRNEQLRKKQGG